MWTARDHFWGRLLLSWRWRRTDRSTPVEVEVEPQTWFAPTLEAVCSPVSKRDDFPVPVAGVAGHKREISVILDMRYSGYCAYCTTSLWCQAILSNQTTKLNTYQTEVNE